MTNFTQPTPATRPETTPPDNRTPASPLAKPQTVVPSVQPQPATAKSNVEPKLPLGDKTGEMESAGGGLKTAGSPVAPARTVLSDRAPKAPFTATPTEPSKTTGEHCDTPKTTSGPTDRTITKQQV